MSAAGGYGTLASVLEYPDIADYVPDEGQGGPSTVEGDDSDDTASVCSDSAFLPSPRPWQRPSRRVQKRWGRAKLLASSSVFFLALCVVLFVHKPVDRRPGRTGLSASDGGLLRKMNLAAAVGGTTSASDRMLRAYNADYGEVKVPTLKLYGMDVLLEPYRETVIEVIGPSSSAVRYEWEVALISRDSGESGETLYQGNTEVANVTVTCTTPGDWLYIKVVETSSDGSQREYETSNAACRYVRREIRSMTDEDRELYLDGIEQVHRLSISEGQAKYGSAFRNYEVFTAMHNSKTFCFHGGDQFITAHAAFTHMLDQSLQLMHPRVISPYWDFMIDSAELGEEWYRSVVYSDDWFGSVDNTEEDNFMITRGRFAYIPTAYDPQKKFENDTDYGPDYNVQGYVACHRNMNSAPYVQRSRQMCGLSEKQVLATCSDFTGCFDDYSTLEDWAMCMEINVHANMHEWHGGAWLCDADLKAVQTQYPQYSTDLLLFLGTVAHDVWFIYTKETVSQYGVCPTSCSADAPDATSGCACLCTLDFDSMDDASVLEAMSGTLFTLQFIFYEGRDFLRFDEDLNGYRFANGAEDDVMSMEDHVRLVRISAKLMCNAGLAGPMGSGAAPNDPIFWPMHPIFDRAWHLLLLSPKYSQSYNLTWTDGNCYGSGWEDVQVFTNLTPGDSGKTYTNAQLWDFFSPQNSYLPYIYDDFRVWGDCPDWNSDVDF